MTVGMAFAVVRERVEGRMRDRLRALSSRLTRVGVSVSNLHTQVGRVLGEEITNRDRAVTDCTIYLQQVRKEITELGDALTLAEISLLAHADNQTLLQNLEREEKENPYIPADYKEQVSSSGAIDVSIPKELLHKLMDIGDDSNTRIVDTIHMLVNNYHFARTDKPTGQIHVNVSGPADSPRVFVQLPGTEREIRS